MPIKRNVNEFNNKIFFWVRWEKSNKEKLRLHDIPAIVPNQPFISFATNLISSAQCMQMFQNNFMPLKK